MRYGQRKTEMSWNRNPRTTRGKREPCDRQVFSERQVAERFARKTLLALGVTEQGHSYVCQRCGALHVFEGTREVSHETPGRREAPEDREGQGSPDGTLVVRDG